jgi:ribosome-associated protein
MEETIKEKSLHPEEAGLHDIGLQEAGVRSALQPQSLESVGEMPAEALDDRILAALNAASEKKALDLVLIDLRAIATFTDYFLITSGANQRQVQAISDEVVDKLKKAGTPAARVEGYRSAEWVLVDYGDFIVHVFEDKARKFYDLERLWREGKRVELPAQFVSEPVSTLRKES